MDATISDDIKTSAWTSRDPGDGLHVHLHRRPVPSLAVRSRWHAGPDATCSSCWASIPSSTAGCPSAWRWTKAFIAAILTVVGYSINDSVVVFDRIREYLMDHKRDDTVTVFNKAMNATLGRTLQTSLTTLLVLLIIFIFGGVAIQGFVFALLVGILVGTYSSIFVASAFVVDLMKGQGQEHLSHSGLSCGGPAASRTSYFWPTVMPLSTFPLLFDISGGELMRGAALRAHVLRGQGHSRSARGLGRTMRQVRDATQEVKREIDRGAGGPENCGGGPPGTPGPGYNGFRSGATGQLMDLLYTLGGAAVLILGAELLLRGGPPGLPGADLSLVVGLTVVSLGTSLPELLVSLVATR